MGGDPPTRSTTGEQAPRSHIAIHGIFDSNDSNDATRPSHGSRSSGVAARAITDYAAAVAGRIILRTSPEAHTAALEVARALGIPLNTFVALAVVDAVQRAHRDRPELQGVIDAQRKLRSEARHSATILEGSHDG